LNENDNELEQLRAENELLEQERDMLLSHLYRFIQAAETTLDARINEIKLTDGTLTELFNQYQQRESPSPLLERIKESTSLILASTNHFHEQARIKLKKTHENLKIDPNKMNIAEYFVQLFWSVEHYTHAATAGSIAVLFFEDGLTYDDEPEVIAQGIIEVLAQESPDKKRIQLKVSSLWDWISTNISNAPTKKDTFTNGLLRAQKYTQSDMIQQAFAKQESIGEKRLRDYLIWLEAIKALSKAKAGIKRTFLRQ